MKINKLLVFPIFIFVIAIFGVFGIYFWWDINSKPASNDKSPVRVVIPRGRTASQIAEDLYKKKLIRNPLAFKFYVQFTSRADKIQAGEFQLSANLTIPEIIDVFSKGPLQLWVTIPEGLRREEVVERFITGLEMPQTQAQVFRQKFLNETEGKEGYLFPDTYLFPRDATSSAIIKALISTFEKKIDEVGADEKAKNKLTLNEIVTLASLIERETKTEEERPLVAGIIFNRLRIDMPLQIDAAVQYAVASEKCKDQSAKCNDWWPILTRDDLDIDSSYNTYKFKGLPPDPIASPGLSSLKAALIPEDSDYLFYIHDANGKIHYAKTLSEHNENVRKYLGK